MKEITTEEFENLIKSSNILEHFKNLVFDFKQKELPDAESPFHYEAEIWSGFKSFIEFLDKK